MIQLLAFISLPLLVTSLGWTWMSGSQYSGSPIVTGEWYVQSPQNQPEAISESTYTFSTKENLLFIYGGYRWGGGIDNFWIFNRTSKVCVNICLIVVVGVLRWKELN
jgi:hypothetical protein